LLHNFFKIVLNEITFFSVITNFMSHVEVSSYTCVVTAVKVINCQLQEKNLVVNGYNFVVCWSE